MGLKNYHVIFSQRWTVELCLQLGWLVIKCHSCEIKKEVLKNVQPLPKIYFENEILCYTPYLFIWQENELKIAIVSVIALAAFL